MPYNHWRMPMISGISNSGLSVCRKIVCGEYYANKNNGIPEVEYKKADGRIFRKQL